jgi:hypothetical protein
MEPRDDDDRWEPMDCPGWGLDPYDEDGERRFGYFVYSVGDPLISDSASKRNGRRNAARRTVPDIVGFLVFAVVFSLLYFKADLSFWASVVGALVLTVGVVDGMAGGSARSGSLSTWKNLRRKIISSSQWDFRVEWQWDSDDDYSWCEE